MTFARFWNQLCQLGIQASSLTAWEPAGVVIRGQDGDYEIAAVHVDYKTGELIFDLGRKL